MKRIFPLLLAVCTMFVLFAGCSKNDNNDASATSSTVSGSSAASGNTSQSISANTALDALYDVNQLLSVLTEAAALGGTVDFTVEDLIGQSDIDADNIVAMAGVKSNMYQENGGIVVVIQAAEGKGDAVKESLTDFRDGILAVNANYATEYPVAYGNLSQARITNTGDYVVLAASATGEQSGYDQLDAALATLFDK